VLPKKLSRNIFDADPDSLAAVMRTTQKLARALMKAFSADGVTVQQFNEPAGGQVVFHLHVHVIPRFEGVPLRPHTGAMEKPEVLAANAENIRDALAAE
jgi:histidine triad (HIT) family protein